MIDNNIKLKDILPLINEQIVNVGNSTTGFIIVNYTKDNHHEYDECIVTEIFRQCYGDGIYISVTETEIEKLKEIIKELQKKIERLKGQVYDK